MINKWLLGLCFICFPTLFLQAIPLSEQSAEQAYRGAVNDASIVESGEVSKNLISIDRSTPGLIWHETENKILMVSWKSQSSYEQHLKSQTQTSMNEAYVIWVTTAPQVQQFCQAYRQDNPNATDNDLNLRLKQYLGLNYDWNYDVFIEMWVDPAELFRPCMDPQVNDAQCNLSFSDPVPQVKNISDYPAFYKNLYFSDFRATPGVPWTGLGYTYDWGNPLTEEGASEFILIPGAHYSIKQTVPTAQYCQP